jgi:hypothetical protein
MLCVLAVSVALSTGGCGGGAGEPVVSPERLASSLVTADDLEGDWTVTAPPPGAGVPASGVVPPELRDAFPGIELCERASAASRAALDGLRWKAFREIKRTEQDTIDPPEDLTGRIVFVQEFLTSDTPGEVETTFGLLRDGMRACLGDIPAGEEGPGTAVAMPVPEVGDGRYGVLTTFEEAGGWAEWRVHNALVRRGGVLMLMGVVEIRAGVEPRYTVGDVGGFVTTAVDRLPPPA